MTKSRECTSANETILKDPCSICRYNPQQNKTKRQPSAHSLYIFDQMRSTRLWFTKKSYNAVYFNIIYQKCIYIVVKVFHNWHYCKRVSLDAYTVYLTYTLYTRMLGSVVLVTRAHNELEWLLPWCIKRVWLITWRRHVMKIIAASLALN